MWVEGLVSSTNRTKIQAAALCVWLERVLAKPVHPGSFGVHSKLDVSAT